MLHLRMGCRRLSGYTELRVNQTVREASTDDPQGTIQLREPRRCEPVRAMPPRNSATPWVATTRPGRNP